ncbi:MAG TPA: hypothetical protein VHD56_02860 [Tepidisphaeraceae bacterium]|nr:hypothetical protein [Tepidisphaeraceae bacterium]
MIRIGLILIFGLTVIGATNISQAQSVSVNWLDQSPPAVNSGVSFGVPWPKGAVKKEQTFTIKSADGKSLAVQSWPLAYWPDGSIKWTGFATIAGPDAAGPLQIAPGAADAVAQSVEVSQSNDSVDIDTGFVKARISKSGANLIDSMTVDGKEVARHGHLELILQNGPQEDWVNMPPRQMFVSNIKKVTVEQSGPVRAVVKIEGMHQLQGGGREWLPFIVRLYFYAGESPVRVVHTILFDGDQEKDFIRGLGLVFDVPMREEVQNRHVRFSNGNGGLFAEPVLLPATGAGGARGGIGRGGGPNQLDGQRVGPTTSELAQWDAFKLVQPNSEGFTIVKRTNPKSSWVGVGEGKRSLGLVFAGDVTGGLAVGVKNFWQSYPASLEVENATKEAAQLKVWLWSPDAPGMDLRHYDIRGHGPVNGGSGSYEDYEADFATPVGVGRTSDLMLYPTASVPSRDITAKQAQVNAQPPLLVCTPQYMHSLATFGVWSLPDRSTPFKKAVEDHLEGLLELYKSSIDEHHWYGFWNFGDVRHAYDPARHQWRYDVGGYAWDNTELGSLLWLWYSYVRTGRADLFRMAEAMTRHTTEVDTYHFGRFKGLGSRHNVDHWGDSAKEARVSQATHERFMYYLTTDERIGDILDLVADADSVASALDPMRKAQPKTPEEAKYPGRIRVGPDWLAFVGNWMTAWERTGDTKWRDKIMAGVTSLEAMPYWMRTGRNLVVGYDPATGKLYQVNDQPGTYNLPTIQGGAEVAFELTDLLNDPSWTRMWLQYCRLGSAPAEVLIKDKTTGNEGADASMMGEQGGSNSQGTSRLAAFAYAKTKNPAFAKFAIEAMAGRTGTPFVIQKVQGPMTLNPVDESVGVSTNEAAQASLSAIEILELCNDQMPAEVPALPEGGRRGGRGRGQ